MGRHTTLLQRVRSHRFVRPVNVRLRIVLLGNEAVHYAVLLASSVSNTDFTVIPVSRSNPSGSAQKKPDPRSHTRQQFANSSRDTKSESESEPELQRCQSPYA